MTGFYVLNSLIWSVVGAVIGYRYGKMQMDVNEMKRRLHMSESPNTPVDPTPAVAKELRWGLHRPSVQQVVGVVVIVMSLVSVSVIFGYTHRLNSVSTCLSNYVSAYNEALKSRDAIASKSRTSLSGFIQSDVDLWLGILKNVPSQAGQQATEAQRAASLVVLNNFLAKSRDSIASLDEVGKARQDFPIPDNTCPGSEMRR